MNHITVGGNLINGHPGGQKPNLTKNDPEY